MALVKQLENTVTSLIIEETGTLVLQGLEKDIESVTSVLADVDVPQPQVRLYCELIEAYVPGATKDPHRLSGNFAEAMEAINLGKAFRSRGRAMVRSSVGGRRSVRLSTIFPGLVDDDPSLMMELEAQPTAWDCLLYTSPSPRD